MFQGKITPPLSSTLAHLLPLPLQNSRWSSYVLNLTINALPNQKWCPDKMCLCLLITKKTLAASPIYNADPQDHM